MKGKFIGYDWELNLVITNMPSTFFLFPLECGALSQLNSHLYLLTWLMIWVLLFSPNPIEGKTSLLFKTFASLLVSSYF
jgi:hypothetical protein